MIRVKIQQKTEYGYIEFPTTDTNLHNELMKINPLNPDETTVFVNEISYPEEMNVLNDLFIDLDEMNYLAKRFDSFSENEEKKFFEIIKMNKLSSLKDLINLSFNLNNYALITNLKDAATVGREYKLETEGCVPAHDEDNPEYAEIGKKLICSGNGILTKHGLLFIKEKSMDEYYNGKNFPCYLYDQCLMVGEMQYGGNTEYIYLPSEDYAIEKAVKRLQAESCKNCTVKLFNVFSDNDTLIEIGNKIIENDGIYALNDLLETINKNIDYPQFTKLSAVVEYSGAEDIKSIIKLSDNLSAFEYEKEIYSYQDLGKRWLTAEFGMSIPSELERYFNFEEFGKNVERDNNGKFLSGGDFVSMSAGYDIAEILEQEENQGLSMNEMK